MNIKVYTVMMFFCMVLLTASCDSQQKKGHSASSQSSAEEILDYKDITVDEADDIRRHRPEVIFLDVRTPEEVAEGMISGAINADYRSEGFEQQLLTLDTAQTYVVYCRSGKRSAKSARIMVESGFSDVMNMAGGYSSWKKKIIE